MFPSIDAEDVGNTGLFWLFFTYGYVLYYASNLISEGSDLLLLVPSMAGLVGGVVLPLLGAIPDGAIMLFSGLGPIEQAQETLSVGVGALAGSTIMLLTIPWSLAVFAGRVNLIPGPNDKLVASYRTPKLKDGSWGHTLFKSGVSISGEVRHGAVVMMVTTVPYFLIQVPASFLGEDNLQERANKEHWWAAASFAICLIGFLSYMYLQVKNSTEGTDRNKRVAVMKKLLQEGKVSLSGALADAVMLEDHNSSSTLDENGPLLPTPPESIMVYLRELLHGPFVKYDQDRSNTLEKDEMRVLLKDFSENILESDVNELFNEFDADGDGTISFDEFITACYRFIRENIEGETGVLRDSDDSESRQGNIRKDVSMALMGGPSHELETNNVDGEEESNGDEEEEEDMPEDIASLPPAEQQAAIKKRAFLMLSVGTILVAIFSDPMVDVMQEIANRCGIPPFYVSFILAPLAANAAEVIASRYYAAKKTRKTITVSLTALEGAASMNNTFCLSIFMGLIFVRGLVWQYTAETITIVVVQFVVGLLTLNDVMTTMTGCVILMLFPLSLVLIASLEALGLD